VLKRIHGDRIMARTLPLSSSFFFFLSVSIKILETIEPPHIT